MGLQIPVLVAAVSAILLWKMHRESKTKNRSSWTYKAQIMVQLRSQQVHQEVLGKLANCSFLSHICHVSLNNSALYSANWMLLAGKKDSLLPAVSSPILGLVVWRTACPRPPLSRSMADNQHAVGVPYSPSKDQQYQQ